MSEILDEAVMAAYKAVDYSIPPEMVELAVRAALGVLRKPSVAMIEAGQEANNLLENPHPSNAFKFLSRAEMISAWQFMLDKAVE